MAEEQQQENSGKLKEKFEKNINKLNSLLGGSGSDDKLKADNKIKKSELTSIIDELFQEEREKKQLETKEKFKKLITNYREYLKLVREKEKELETLKSNKMKEYNKEAEDLFKTIQDDQVSQQEAIDGLAQAAGEGTSV